MKKANKGREILVMTVDVGKGQKEDITVREEDEPSELARNFALKHKLDQELEEALAQQIEHNIDLLIQEQTPQKPFKQQYMEHWNQELEKKLRKEPKFQPKIDQNSEKIAKSKHSAPVFERLHSRASKTPKSQENSYRSQQSTRRQSPNYGEHLYYKGKLSKEKLEQKRLTERLKRQEEEDSQLTFKPRINLNSSDIVKRSGSSSRDSKKEYSNFWKAELMAAESKICTFTPKVNPTSKKLLKNKPKKDIFNDLYKEAKSKKARQENIAEEL